MKRKFETVENTQECPDCTEYDNLNILDIVWEQDWSFIGSQGCYSTPNYYPFYKFLTRGTRRCFIRVLNCEHKIQERHLAWKYCPKKNPRA